MQLQVVALKETMLGEEYSKTLTGIFCLVYLLH